MTDAGSADLIVTALRERLAGQYTIERLLGQGGMGSVYLARDATLDRPVAIKVISGDVATNPQLKERFLLEARTVAKLRHPNLVAVYAAGDAGGLLWFAMEFVPGESLRDLLAREGKVEPVRAERILHELALALDYAHSNGIVHRDVKPENILLDGQTGRAMLTDFGVARALEGDGRMTGTGMILGSPRYMSPEQATGETTIDGRSDLYALALVGYEMFTGKPVVESGNVAGMLVKHLTETPKPLADAVTNVPEGVAIAIDRALTKDREQRWNTGREMAEVIGMAWTPSGATQGLGTRAATGIAIPRTAKRSRRGLFIVAAAVIAVAASAFFFLRGDGAPAGVDARKSYVVVPFEVQSGSREVQWLRDGAVNMLTLALSQWTDLDVVDYERTLVLVRDAGFEEKRVALDDARSIARRAGAWTIVMGQVSTTTDSLIVVARLYDVASGKSLNTASRSIGLAADPRPLFDGLARYLLDVAGGTGGDAVDLAAATTTSLGAYRAYLDGVRFLNSWQLNQADSAFKNAIAQDSTFALAWHKRSLALGWGNFSGDANVIASQRAAELADRLPVREQGLVRGHLALSLGLQEQMRGGSSRPRLLEAQQIYRTMLATDSTTAEAWYGLADALFHDAQPSDSIRQHERRMTGSVRAFHQTLALDSTFHLAYSHLIQMYQGMSTSAGGAVLVGDSVRVLADSATLRALGGVPGIQQLQKNAQKIGLELARGWARTDKDAVTPYTTLANSFAVAGQTDSAVATMDRALARPGLGSPSLKVLAAFYNLLADSPRAQSLVREAIPQMTTDVIRALTIQERFMAIGSAVTIAATTGSGTTLDATIAPFAAYDSLFPGAAVNSKQFMSWYRTGLRVSMGAPMTLGDRRNLVEGIRRIDRLPKGTGLEFHQLSLALPYVAYLASRDTVFSNTVVRWSPPQARFTEFEALDALTKGDTARARTIAAAFPPADSIRESRLSLAGMRAVARAEVLEALGRDRDAIGYYEALETKRFNSAFIDPGWTVYTRSYAARARLYERVGDKPKALAAYNEFLRRFKDGDALTDTERRSAQAGVQRLKESGTR